MPDNDPAEAIRPPLHDLGKHTDECTMIEKHHLDGPTKATCCHLMSLPSAALTSAPAALPMSSTVAVPVCAAKTRMSSHRLQPGDSCMPELP